MPPVTSERLHAPLFLTLLLAAAFGCEPAPKPAAKSPETAEALFAPSPIASAPRSTSTPRSAPVPRSAPTSPLPPAAAPSSDVVRAPAASAMTAKGKYEVNIFTQPASVYFSVKDRVAFDIQIPKAMQLFEYTKGRKPTSHDEFMNEIITRNVIKLPELLPEHRYVYDPKLGELMVESPKE